MYGSLFLALICIGIVVVAAIAAIVILLEKDRRNKPKDARGGVVDSTKPARPQRKNWIAPIVIALILAIWSVTSAVFLLLIVWILRLDPKSEVSHVVTDVERKICATNYKWLRNSSFITIPVFFIAFLLGTSPAVAALIPFIFHISLIQRLKTKSLYVYRHTQQSLLLLLLRAASASIIFSIFYVDEGFWPFILINGSLWLFGTNWEVSQVTRNESWLMRRRGEKIELQDTPVLNQPEVDQGT